MAGLIKGLFTLAVKQGSDDVAKGLLANYGDDVLKEAFEKAGTLTGKELSALGKVAANKATTEFSDDILKHAGNLIESGVKIDDVAKVLMKSGANNKALVQAANALTDGSMEAMGKFAGASVGKSTFLKGRKMGAFAKEAGIDVNAPGGTDDLAVFVKAAYGGTPTPRQIARFSIGNELNQTGGSLSLRNTMNTTDLAEKIYGSGAIHIKNIEKAAELSRSFGMKTTDFLTSPTRMFNAAKKTAKIGGTTAVLGGVATAGTVGVIATYKGASWAWEQTPDWLKDAIRDPESHPNDVINLKDGSIAIKHKGEWSAHSVERGENGEILRTTEREFTTDEIAQIQAKENGRANTGGGGNNPGGKPKPAPGSDNSVDWTTKIGNWLKETASSGKAPLLLGGLALLGGPLLKGLGALGGAASGLPGIGGGMGALGGMAGGLGSILSTMMVPLLVLAVGMVGYKMMSSSSTQENNTGAAMAQNSPNPERTQEPGKGRGPDALTPEARRDAVAAAEFKIDPKNTAPADQGTEHEIKRS